MYAKSIAGYYWFGASIRFLQDVTKGQKIHGAGCILPNIGKVFGHLDSLDLQVTQRAARELKEYMDELSDTEKDSTLTQTQASKQVKLITDLRRTLEAELQGFEAYLITPKRIDLTKLTNNVDELFSPNVFWQLPNLAIYDFMEAGKCIAFERPTAAAFHILRATEEVLRFYYTEMIGQKRVKLMWGNIVEDLRKRRKTKGNTALLNNLDNVRASFRNPTQHPEKIYDIDEVQDLWSLCVDVVNRMIRHVEKENSQQAPPARRANARA